MDGIQPEAAAVAEQLSEKDCVGYVTGTKKMFSSGSIERELHIQMSKDEEDVNNVTEILQDAGYSVELCGLTDRGDRILRATA